MIHYVSTKLINQTYVLDNGDIYAPSDGKGDEKDAPVVHVKMPADLDAHIKKLNEAVENASAQVKAEQDAMAAKAQAILDGEEKPAG